MSKTRIHRLARRLQCRTGDLAHFVQLIEPSLPRTMVLRSIDLAIAEIEDTIGMFERDIARSKAEIAALRAFRSKVFRGAFAVVDGDRS